MEAQLRIPFQDLIPIYGSRLNHMLFFDDKQDKNSKEDREETEGKSQQMER